MSERRPVIKVKVEALDPTGIISDTQELTYQGEGPGARMILTIGEFKYMVTGMGSRVNMLFTAVEEK